MTELAPDALVERIETALSAAEMVFAEFDQASIAEMTKSGGDPVTEADIALDTVLREVLLMEDEGWLSEETADDRRRLTRQLVWIVDPLDGTREFIDGLPEFCTSVAAVIDGIPVAAGVLNPAERLRIVGAVGVGLTCNGATPTPRAPADLDHCVVLASRSEVSRGQWDVIESAGIGVKPMGSVAYKLARVAAGLDDATWTPVPKHEWDVAGGAGLLAAAGGAAVGLDGEPLVFNRAIPWLEGMIALPPGFERHLATVLRLVVKQMGDSE